MGYPTKIATCCYCGTRAALILKGNISHELACKSCGAPLHELKRLPIERTGDRELIERPKPTKWKLDKSIKSSKPPKPKKPKKKPRKSLFKSVLEEAFDIVEDIFD